MWYFNAQKCQMFTKSPMVVFQWKMLTFLHLNITDSWGIFHSTKAFPDLANSACYSQKESRRGRGTFLAEQMGFRVTGAIDAEWEDEFMQ